MFSFRQMQNFHLIWTSLGRRPRNKPYQHLATGRRGRAGIGGMVRRASAAAPRVTRLAAAAADSRCAVWARKGPATEPTRVAAASAVRNTALTRPSAAPGIDRCKVVCWITSDMEPDRATVAAAGSAVASDDEVKSRKYAPAVAVRLAVSRLRGCARSRN